MSPGLLVRPRDVGLSNVTPRPTAERSVIPEIRLRPKLSINRAQWGDDDAFVDALANQGNSVVPVSRWDDSPPRYSHPFSPGSRGPVQATPRQGRRLRGFFSVLPHSAPSRNSSINHLRENLVRRRWVLRLGHHRDLNAIAKIRAASQSRTDFEFHCREQGDL